MTTAIIITEAYPLGGLAEAAFAAPEIAALAAEFDRVVALPLMERGPMAEALPPNVEVARDVFDAPEWRHRWLRPLVCLPALVGGLRSPRYAMAAAVVERALRRIMARLGLTAADTVAEAFWLDFPAVALARLRRRSGIRFMARAHRYDIVMNRAAAMRAAAVGASDGVAAVSHAGADELRRRFPRQADLITTAYLGTDVSCPVSAHSPQGSREVRFLSVSSVEPRKRVTMALTMATALAAARRSTEVYWTHIGDGSSMDALREAVAAVGLPNLHIELRGAMPHSAVMDYYATHAVDWLMHWSESEGLPMAILEALARGVPVVASAVDGVPEAVDDDCGLLMPPDAAPEEFVQGIIPYLDSPVRYDAVARGARARACAMFDAATLRRDFALTLKSLLP